MSYITGWIVVGIITLGIYKLFELFVGKKERLTMIEKLGDKLDPSMLGNRLSLPLPVGTPFMSSFPISFSALKFGCLLLGMGLGLLTGYMICVTTVPDYFTERNWHMSELTSLIYGANVLLFGGLGLVVAFIVELKISQKKTADTNLCIDCFPRAISLSPFFSFSFPTLCHILPITLLLSLIICLRILQRLSFPLFFLPFQLIAMLRSSNRRCYNCNQLK